MEHEYAGDMNNYQILRTGHFATQREHTSQVRDGWETTEVNWTILKFSELFLVGCDLSMFLYFVMLH